MEQSIVTALIILGSIFLVFSAIFTTGEIATKKTISKSLKGQVQKLQSKKLKKGLTMQEENLLAEILEELNAAAQIVIDAREERASRRYWARLKPAFQEFVRIKQGGGKPSAELIAMIKKDNADEGLAA